MQIQNKYHLINLFPILILILFTLQAKAEFDQNNTVQISSPVHNSTVLVNLKPIDCTNQESERWSRALRSELPDIPNIVMISRETIMQAEILQTLPKTCDAIKCAELYARAVNSHMVIAGSLKKIEEEKERLMGDEGKYKYLLHKKADVTYSIKIILYDAVKKTELTTIQRKTKESEINKTINYIVNKIKPFYLPPVIIPKEIPVKPIEKKITRVLTLQAEYLFPRGKYSDFSGAGYGLSVYGGLNDFFFRNSTVSIFLSGIYLSPESNGVKKYVMNKIGLHLLYELNISSNYSILPGLSTGYLLHNVNTKTEGFRMYWDPFVQCELNLRKYIKEDVYLQVGPSYIVFFEKTNRGHALEGHISAVLFYK
jgi:hypothetical protein